MTLTLAKETLKLKELKRIFIALLLAFILIGVATAVVMKDNVSFAKEIVDSFVKSKGHILGAQGIQLALELFKNNFQAAALSIVLGFIPFLTLPVLTVVLNAVILGGFYQFFLQLPGTSSFAYFMSILPHGILEIPAFILASTLGIYLCLEISRKILKKSSKTLGEVLQRVISVLLFIILPLLIVAAAIEAFITPVIIQSILS